MKYFLLFLLMPFMTFAHQCQCPIYQENYLCPVYWHDQYIYMEFQGHIYKIVQLEHDLNVCDCLKDIMYKPID